jgi:mRNA interferase HigB
MRIISKKKLVEFWNRHPNSEKPLSSWYNIARRAQWKNVNQVNDTLPYVSVLSNSRIVFNIKGNNYRLIVEARFRMGLLYICWVGTHDEYDKIDANKVWDD